MFNPLIMSQSDFLLLVDRVLKINICMFMLHCSQNLLPSRVLGSESNIFLLVVKKILIYEVINIKKAL